MKETELKKYAKLNELADQEGIVIFGNGEDKLIPICELRQAFAIESKIYNRSFEDISVKDAVHLYEQGVSSLFPETVLLHLGEADMDFFRENASAFDQKYRELIGFIKKQNKDCRIAVISLKNYDNDAHIGEMNRHLKYIADSEGCEYGDIAEKKVWNPKTTMDVSSFVYSVGFVRPLKNKRPLYDLVKILFCYET